MESESLFKVRYSGGKGRTFVLLSETGDYDRLLEALISVLESRAKVYWIETVRVHEGNWISLSTALSEFIDHSKIRQASFVSFGAASAMVQNFCLHEPRMVRTMVFVDATTRPHPTRWLRFVDWLEHALPLGLPFRLRTRHFDVKPFLQRLRCPVLIVTTDRATSFVHAEAEVMHRAIPTAWVEDIAAVDNAAEDLSNRILEFQGVAAKCPQKGQEMAA